MDLLSHTVLTYVLVDRRPVVLLAGIGPDVPWYLTYPVWVVMQGQAREALTSSRWPDPPDWMLTLHHASHSIPLAVAGAVALRALTGRWPRAALSAWLLHITVDMPTHSRRFWGPRFLWPFSDFAVDGVPWAEITSSALSRLLRRLRP